MLLHCMCSMFTGPEEVFTARKRSSGQGYIFSSMCQEFCSQRGLPQCMLGYYHPTRPDTPWIKHPPRADTSHLPEQTSPEPGTLPSRHPQEQTPPQADPLCHSACWEIRSISGRYASYWNAIVFKHRFICINQRQTLMESEMCQCHQSHTTFVGSRK